jgi:hydrogen cyanide synthase HcnA
MGAAPTSPHSLTLTIDGKPAEAHPGETVLTVLLAHEQKAISRNDRGLLTGAYCGMGVCFSCLVLVDGIKARACKIEAQEGMNVSTRKNLFDLYAPPKAPGEPEGAKR